MMFLISGAALLRASFGTGAGRELEGTGVGLLRGSGSWLSSLGTEAGCALEETGKVLLR